jgi:large subunit ribosomal protein L30e
MTDLCLSVIQIELGTACGKLFRCSTMAIIDAGDSDILSSQTA